METKDIDLTQLSDLDLIQRVLDGDENAFTVLVNRYQKQIHALVWQKIGDFHIAEEITQDVFLKAYRRLGSLKPPYNFAGWLYVIATRRCIAWHRKHREPTTSLDAMTAVEIEALSYARYEEAYHETTDLEHQREVIKRLLEKLPESERTVVTMHYIAEMSCEQISEFLGVSPNTIKSRLYRARKRLERYEHLLRDISGICQVPPTLTSNIIEEVARIKPGPPAASKPWLPWGIPIASTLLIILMIGIGSRALLRFQQPYNLEATSEMRVELIEAPLVLPLKRKPDVRTQPGNADTLGEKSGSGQQPGPSFATPLHPKETDVPATQSRWIQARGPGGVSDPGLFLASDKSLYAVMTGGLYRLTASADAWKLVNPSGPDREFSRRMAEHGDTLYLLTSDALLASTDSGKTWGVLGSRPEGSVTALVITDGPKARSPQNAGMTMFLVLRTDIYRSEDTGKTWESIAEVLRSDGAPDVGTLGFHIWDAFAIDNALFVGTSRGLFRFANGWQKISVPTPHGIYSLAVAENRIYLGTVTNLRHSSRAHVFYSIDFGDSWTDITPNTSKHSGKMLNAIRVVPAGKTLMLIGFKGVLLSYDGGETYMDPGNDPHAFGPFPITALDENTFYRAYPAGITRSMDGGVTWQPFTTGLTNFNLQNLSSTENVLYAVTAEKIFKSKRSGEFWETLSRNDRGTLLTWRIETTDAALYASCVTRNRPQLFHLSVGGDSLIPLQGVPDFKKDDLCTEWQKRLEKARETNVKVHEMERLWRKKLPSLVREDTTNGGFTVTGKTVFMEYRRKLFRWRFGETEWYDTGLEDHGALSPIRGKGITLSASGNSIYAGKRDGALFRSLDNGNTWNDITKNLAFPFADFKEIICVGPAVYISTDTGVMFSRDGDTWHPLTDIDGWTRPMDHIAAEGSTLYGVCDNGAYQVDNETDKWKQIAPKVPSRVTALTVMNATLYAATRHGRIFHFQPLNQ